MREPFTELGACRRAMARFKFGALYLEFVWDLVLGIWEFPTASVRLCFAGRLSPWSERGRSPYEEGLSACSA